MKLRYLPVFLMLSLIPEPVWCQTPAAVRFNTSLGAINVNLLTSSAPNTVANFLSYVNSGAYTNSFFHRSVQSGIFIIQGGGYVYNNGNVITIPSGPPILSEFSVSNTRGTLAMALSGNPDGTTNANSATNEWFFNNKDNSANLDPQKFTVFGQVADAASLAVMDQIAALPIVNAGSFFTNIPLINFNNGGTITAQNLVIVSSIAPVLPAPLIEPGGIVTASGFGAFAAAAPGSFIEIYGTNLAGTSRGWAATDFNNGAAPTALDGVTVTVNGQPAYVDYVSPNQVNVQVPANAPVGSVPVVVSYGSQSSAPIPLTVRAAEGGLLALPSFNVAGKQYVVAVHASTGAFVSNGSIPNYPAAPAMAGETLVFYGVGFGPVTPASTPVAGQIVQGATALVSPVTFTFGSAAAQIAYQGFAPGEVGLYQFNVVVPANLGTGDIPLQITQNGISDPQTLFISLQ